jgi:hypothetical protein
MTPTSASASGPPTAPVPSGTPRKKRRKATEAPLAWRLLSENFGLKLLSLLVALGFYASMHTASNAQRTLQVPIVADMPSQGGSRVLVSDIPQTISVTIEGPRQQLDDLEAKLDPIPLNLRQAEEALVTFTPAMIAGLPKSVRVSRIIPESLTIHWENVMERAIEVQVPVAGQLAKGLELRGEIAVAPERVKAKGPESVVKRIQLARTEPFEIGGLGEGRFTRTLGLQAPPPKVSFDVSNIDATLEVGRKLVSRELIAKVNVIGLARGRAEPAVVRVVVSGTPERMATLRPDSVLVRVDPKAAGIDPNKPGNALMPVIVDVLEAKATAEPPQVVIHW